MGSFIQFFHLDETSKKSDNKFMELPVLAALRDDSCRQEDLTQAQPRSSLGIGPEISDRKQNDSIWIVE